MCLSFAALMKARSKEDLGTEYIEICVDLTGFHSAGLMLFLCKVDLSYTVTLNQRSSTPSHGPYATALGNILNVGC